MATKENDKATQQDASEQESSKGGVVIRALVILALVVFLAKPYLFKEETTKDTRQLFKIHGVTMGTTWNASVVASPETLVALNLNGVADDSGDKADQPAVSSCEEFLARLVQRELDKIDLAASTYRVDSDVSKFNKSESADWIDVSYDVAKIVDIALDVSRKTKGAFDVTVAPLVNLYRFGPNKSPLAAFPSDEEIEALRARVGYEKLEVRLEPTPALKKADPALTIDLSSVAKGYAVDIAGQKLEELGLNNYMLEVGGEVRCAGEKFDYETREPLPWVLGVQKPKAVQQPDDLGKPDVYRLLRPAGKDSNSALATSGDYNNAAQVGTLTFSHFVDPRSGKPADLADENDDSPRLGSVSVVSLSCDALSCAQADAFATAFFVLGADEGIPLANELGVAVLYVYRFDPAASKIDEKSSETFDKIDSNLADEQIETLK